MKEARGSSKNRAVNPSWEHKPPRGVGGTAPTLLSCQILPSGSEAESFPKLGIAKGATATVM